MPTNSKLWQRTEDFDIGNSGDEIPFSARLARERDWPPEKTGAVIEESFAAALVRFIARGLRRTSTGDVGNDRSTGAHGRGYRGGGYWGCEG